MDMRVVEAMDQVMAPLDAEMAECLHDLKAKSIHIRPSCLSLRRLHRTQGASEVGHPRCRFGDSDDGRCRGGPQCCLPWP